MFGTEGLADVLGRARAPLDALARVYRRRVTGTPHYYRVYVKLPAGPDGALDMGEIAARIEELEHLAEGRLDVRGVDATVVETDPLPGDGFDVSAFESFLDSLEERVAATHRLRVVTTWRRHDGGLLKSYLVAPVRPVFGERNERAAAGRA